MTDILAHLGALALGGAIAILLLWATARFTRSRCAARWRCWAWLLLCLRLAVPLPLSVPSLPQPAAPVQISVPADQVIYQAAAANTGSGLLSPVSGPATPSIPSAAYPAPDAVSPEQGAAVPSTPFSVTLSGLLVVLWLAGAAAVLLWNIRNHLRFLRYLRRWAHPISNPEVVAAFNRIGDQLGLDSRPRLMACQGLRAPMLAGLFQPVLLIPVGRTSGDVLTCSLYHELTHFRRRDIPFKALVLWVTALHWFNPAVWLMARTVERDIELACDDAVLRRLSPDGHAAYGKTILQAAAHLKEVS